MIDLTKKYVTRNGYKIRDLRRVDQPVDNYVLTAYVYDQEDPDLYSVETWTETGQFIDRPEEESGYDLVLAPGQEAAPRPALTFPDPKHVEYARFVAAVQVNFYRGAFATATNEEFESWLTELVPSIRKP